MEKFKFEFKVKAAEDPKSNIICITSITKDDKHIFKIPEKFQPVNLHETIYKSQVYQSIKTTLQKRHEKRQIWISMSPEIKDTYMDQDGNMQFRGYLLEEFIVEEHKPGPSYGITEEALSKILDSFAEKKIGVSKPQNLTNLSEKFVIDKFSAKTSNVLQWMNNFEAECMRFEITEDVKKIEIFKLFLSDSCMDWYSSMLIKHTINSEWKTWRKLFCETYADKGWTPVRYAMLFKYRQGTLLDYALRKERLLLEINKSMDKTTLIDLIVIGLPNFIADKIDRHCLKETEDLFNNLRGLEHLIKTNKKIPDKKIENSENKFKGKYEKNGLQPCPICEKENRGSRYHPESLCWFKNKNIEKQKKDHIRSVNNFELEAELNETEPKN